MARTGTTGVLALRFVPSIANKAAPTVAEINAGTDLTALLVRDGLTTPLEGNTIDVSDVSSSYNSTAAGTYGGQPVGVKLLRDTVSGSDTGWSTLPRLTSGFLVVRRFGGATNASGDAFASAQRVEVWPITVLSREMMQIAENEAQKFEVKCAVTSAPNDSAVVA
jgi:hypothetical protein